MKKTVLFRQFLLLGAVFLIIVLVMPGSAKFPYDYRKGREWKYENLYAQYDFPIYKTAEQIRQERNSSIHKVIPYYRYSDETGSRVVNSIESLSLGNIGRALSSSVRSIYSRGVISDDSRRQRNDRLEDSDVIYLEKNRRATKIPVSEVYTQESAKAKLLSDLIAYAPSYNADSLFRARGILDLIVPNVIYDSQTTELVQAESVSEISPTLGYVTAGQLIVSEGELVTADIEQMIDSYKREYEINVGYTGTPFLTVIGNILIAFALVVLLYFVVHFCCPAIFGDSRFDYVLTLFTVSAVITLLVSSNGGSNGLYFIPFSLFAIMYQAFMPRKDMAPIYLVSLTPLLIPSSVGHVLFFMYAVSGLVMMFVFKYFQRGWKQFIAAFINFAMLGLIFLGFRLADILPSGSWMAVLGLFVASMAIVAGYPLVYLFEKIFNMVSFSRLVELCDTSNSLIRELEKKAPGSFQHSLQVMNMADMVARAVGVNPDLVRAGALYHDIGKTMNPLCFVENEFLIKDSDTPKYHDGLTPRQSTADIMRHVTDGIDIARKHRLPKEIIDFISTHHGTTIVRFFYDKFVKEGGDPAEIDSFRYPGKKPANKAQIILMLCDSVEAASRTLKGNTEKVYSDFVERIVAGKMEEGQFDEADITIREITAIKETLKLYLAQLNHERVVYPKNKLHNK